MLTLGDSVYIKKKYREYEANRQNNEGVSESGNLPAKARIIGYLVYFPASELIKYKIIHEPVMPSSIIGFLAEFQPSDFTNNSLKHFTNLETQIREKYGIKYALIHRGNPIPRFQIEPVWYMSQIDPVSYKIIDPPKTMRNQLAQRGGKKTRRRARGRKGTRKAH